jgi:hypothetical protein
MIRFDPLHFSGYGSVYQDLTLPTAIPLNKALGCRIIEMVGWADTVESAKFTSAELAALVAEAVSWWKQQREKFLPHGIPLSSAQKMQLKPFFTVEILDGVRIVKLPQTGETIPTPPFYEKILAASSSLLPGSHDGDAVHGRCGL